ncbi:MotA/TolQ/ExbB proton channel family protein [Gilvimarinus sp. DA14]|uniref:MotA/TolQ/ExbB proton channel family protein n=1 Tax=Gilvimarinus sp. DA14 TaxID=2956798 RepID=UPI0020B77D33|nr:MotA/TolQ/ExbB proton channel family protein [Gilvimarinus sp. DA14]UTF59410.1 MotA/TolQ/ExbB proton channel family protein [Gilvimarinus sp. DA14]
MRLTAALLSSLLALCVVYTAPAAAQDVETSLVKKIERAQNNLERTEQKVLRERNDVAGKLRSLEEEVLNLRDKTAVARRKMDEKTLSLGQLESRLKDWKEQQRFQQNLLNRFLKQQGYSNQQLAELSLSEKINATNRFSEQLHERMAPQWREEKVVRADGTIAPLPTLHIGPASWYVDAEQAGLAETDNDGHLKSLAQLSGRQSDNIVNLTTNPQGEITFDPTQGRALHAQQTSETLIEHIAKGGLWAAPILLFALIATATALFKGWQLWQLPKLIPARTRSELQQQRANIQAQKGSMQKALLDTALNSNNPRERDDRLFAQLHDDKTVLERWLTIITVTATVSPLLGLLGTVSGMIETFRMMTTFGSSDPEVISGGIAQALVTTELGLVVAIPALVLGAVLSRKAKRYYHGLESFALVLSGEDAEPQPAKTTQEATA